MRNCCAANQFSGCCEDGECNSATRPIIQILDRPVAKQISETIFLRTLAVAALAAIALSFFFVGLPEMQRWEKANQENVSHVARR